MPKTTQYTRLNMKTTATLIICALSNDVYENIFHAQYEHIWCVYMHATVNRDVDIRVGIAQFILVSNPILTLFHPNQ